jgi:hypothetical protein
MGYAVFGAKSISQLQKHIRLVSADTSRVFISAHAKTRMRSRRISINEVYECLRNGVIRLTPEPNPSKGSLECRMERYVAGCECAVVVALDDDDPDVLVVTVMSI